MDKIFQFLIDINTTSMIILKTESRHKMAKQHYKSFQDDPIYEENKLKLYHLITSLIIITMLGLPII